MSGRITLVIIGPRQTGKTTIVRQLINRRLERQGPETILYVQFDDRKLLDLTASPLQDVLDAYEEFVLKEKLDLTQRPVCLFLDEIQRLPGWQQVVKDLLGANPRLNIVATGSSTWLIKQSGQETLPGRQFLYELYPLKFREFIAILLHDRPAQGKLDRALLTSTARSLREAFQRSIQERDPSGFEKAVQSALFDLASAAPQLAVFATKYLRVGGYPEIVRTMEDREKCQKLLDGYAKDIVLKDMMPLLRIKNYDVADKLLYLLASNSAQKLNVRKLGRALHNAPYQTIMKHLRFYEEVQILSRVPAYTKSKLRRGKHPKIYFFDNGLRNALMGTFDIEPSPAEEGLLAEMAVHDHLRRLVFKVSATSPARHISYYFSTAGKEVDFIAGFPSLGAEVPIEVKFRKTVDERELAALAEFMKLRKSRFGIVVTDKESRREKSVLFIPLWLFLLFC